MSDGPAGETTDHRVAGPPLVAIGLRAGVLAGLVLGARQIAPMLAEGSGPFLDRLPWPALLVVIHVTVGVLFGLIAALIIRPMVRPDGSGAVSAVAATIAAGAVLLVARAVTPAVPFAGWLELLALTLLALGALSIARSREADSEPPPILPAVLGACLGLMFFFLTLGAHIFAPALNISIAVVFGGIVALAVPIGHRRADAHSSAGARALLAVAFALLAVPALIAGIDLARGLATRVPAIADDRAQTAGPNIILISVDTLRADSVGYAGGAARTPNLDRLAESGALFERAYSVAPWTRSSFAAFFASRYPSEMGVARALGVERERCQISPYAWRNDVDTGVEVFDRAGYTTAAVATNWNLTPEANADQGFDAFLHVSQAMLKPPAREVSLRLTADLLGRFAPTALRHAYDVKELERARRVQAGARAMIRSLTARPALLWVHYMDPHEPYDAPTAERKLQVFPDKSATMAGLATRSAPNRQRYLDAYAREIEYFDEWLGALIDELRAAGLWEDAIVVFWSDHGEEFWDHGGWEHGHTLYNELLHVPLVIRLPGGEARARVAEPVSLLDVMPTLLEACGVERPEGMRGRSIASLVDGSRGAVEPFEVYLEGCVWGSVRKAVMTERYKLIHDLSDDSHALYDLTADPGERHDIHGLIDTPQIAALRDRLAAFEEQSLADMDAYRGQTAEKLSPEVRRQLKSMGYIQ